MRIGSSSCRSVRRRFGRNAATALNQIIGDWSVAGLVRWTSGFPFNVYNCRSCWTTNWNVQGNAMLVDPIAFRPQKRRVNIINGRPSPFENPTETLTFFRRALPGEVGIRNLLRGDGYFTIDTSVSKAWSTGVADHRLRFRWDVFNLTNTPKFDVGQMQGFPDLGEFWPIRRLAGDVRCAGWPLHAVRIEVRVLSILKRGFRR